MSDTLVILKKVIHLFFKIVIGLMITFVLIICICLGFWQYDKYVTIKQCMNEGHNQSWCEALWQEIDELD